ncbi:MAG: hypothetical protein HY807_11210 [Nitrospirae bacterium]|nr:hypothetical protein [Nitrospirota bacterium]
MKCKMEEHKKFCNCTYKNCERRLKCCECLHYHREKMQLPACYFTNEAERTYDRSVSNFFRMLNN